MSLQVECDCDEGGAAADMAPPAWSVTCALVPRRIHVRDDGHVCKAPVVRCPFCCRLARTPTTNRGADK